MRGVATYATRRVAKYLAGLVVGSGVSAALTFNPLTPCILVYPH